AVELGDLQRAPVDVKVVFGVHGEAWRLFFEGVFPRADERVRESAAVFTDLAARLKDPKESFGIYGDAVDFAQGGAFSAGSDLTQVGAFGAELVDHAVTEVHDIDVPARGVQHVLGVVDRDLGGS